MSIITISCVDEDQMTSNVLGDKELEQLEDLGRRAASECASGAIFIEE
jgi:hypothetical protein